MTKVRTVDANLLYGAGIDHRRKSMDRVEIGLSTGLQVMDDVRETATVAALFQNQDMEHASNDGAGRQRVFERVIG